MAAVLAERYSSNELTHDYLKDHVGALEVAKTGSAAAERRGGADIAAEPPSHISVTPPTSNATAHAITTAVIPAFTAQASLTSAPARRSVEGVVSSISHDAVVVELAGGGNGVDISLPPALFASDLLKYGAPVTISLDTTLGYRRAVVQRREINAQDRLPGQDVIEDWLRNNN